MSVVKMRAAILYVLEIEPASRKTLWAAAGRWHGGCFSGADFPDALDELLGERLVYKARNNRYYLGAGPKRKLV